MKWLLVFVALLPVGCGTILDLAEGILVKDSGEDVVAEELASADSEYIATVKADTSLAAVAAARTVVEERWGRTLTESEIAILTDAVLAVQDALGARALDSHAEAVRRLEETLRGLAPGG